MSRAKRRLGICGYARLLGLLRKPMTRAAWQQAGPVGKTAAVRLIDAFHRRGRVHIAGWEMGYRAPPVPVWKAGRGVDAPYPNQRPTGKATKPPRKPLPPGPIPPELVTFLSVLDSLEIGQCSRSELAEDCGITLVTVSRVLRVLKESRQIRIQAYHPRRGDGGGPVAHYGLGSNEDAPRPAPQDRRVINQRYRQNRHQASVHRILRCAVPANQPSAAAAA